MTFTSVKLSAFLSLFFSFGILQAQDTPPNVCTTGPEGYQSKSIYSVYSPVPECKNPDDGVGEAFLSAFRTQEVPVLNNQYFIHPNITDQTNLFDSTSILTFRIGSSGKFNVKDGTQWHLVTFKTSNSSNFFCIKTSFQDIQTPAVSADLSSEGLIQVVFSDSVQNNASEYSIAWSDSTQKIVSPYQLPFTIEHSNSQSSVKVTAKNGYNCKTTVTLTIPQTDTPSIFDLELSSKTSASIINPNESVSTQIILRNTGSVAALNTKILIRNPYPEPASIFQSSKISAGDSFDSGSGIWMIKEVLPGDSALISLDFKIVQGGAWYLEAEIYNVNGSDIDSSPFNQSVTEDDFTRTCVSSKILFDSTLALPFDYTINDQTMGIPNWTKDGSALGTANNLTIKDIGIYQYNSATFICPAGDCCPIVVEAGSVNPCCFKQVYLMNRITP